MALPCTFKLVYESVSHNVPIGLLKIKMEGFLLEAKQIDIESEAVFSSIYLTQLQNIAGASTFPKALSECYCPTQDSRSAKESDKKLPKKSHSIGFVGWRGEPVLYARGNAIQALHWQKIHFNCANAFKTGAYDIVNAFVAHKWKEIKLHSMRTSNILMLFCFQRGGHNL